jgi:hypothetical protein
MEEISVGGLSMPISEMKYSEIFKAYEDGKHRRYALLFSVNGGAFVIAQLFSEEGNRKFLGQLSLDALGYGLAAFTLVMGVDIFWFGWRIRQGSGDCKLDASRGIFSMIGRIVLVTICLLIVGGWLLVAAGSDSQP